jgi:dipeptidyl aminopeptidase/acylaminoacyl peptidase
MTHRLFLTFVLFFVSTLSINAQDTNSSYTEKEVIFSNGDVRIAATLLIPNVKDKVPAAVIIHGSGSSTRENAWTLAYADALAKRGIAVLYPDKRGSGKSTGDWITSTFLDLADDAIAGVNFLKNNPQIEKSRIGVIGFSQGGHIVPAAASRSSDIAFAISVSASSVPMMEQIMDEVEKMAEDEGLNKAQIEVVNDINRKAIYAALTGKGYQEYLEALSKAKTGELKGKKVIEGFPTDPNHPAKTFINTIGDYDPIPYWKKVSVPMLFVYGGKDTQIRINKSINRIENTLGKSDYNYSILLFHNNGHGIFREDLLDFMSRWILDKGIS